MPPIFCHTCGHYFSDYKALALHISTNRRTHKNRKARAWAAKMLMINPLKRELPQRVPEDPLKEKTEYGDENRELRYREESGETERVWCLCPQCKGKHSLVLPVEHVRNPHAWCAGECLVVLCNGCRR